MAIKLVLTAEQIGNKIFKGVPRGYDPYEVDKFLDMVIRDYSEFINTIKRQECMSSRLRFMQV